MTIRTDLGNQSEIHVFVLRGLEIMDTNYGQLEREISAEQMWKLGFEMDTGNSFVERYGYDAFNDPEAFEKACVDDVVLLGSAIFSQWRYWTHWAFAPIDKQSQQWFTLAFARLAELTER